MITIPFYETSNFCFSNFSAHVVEFNRVQYPTAEHAFHAQKFSDNEMCERVKNCSSPLEAWKLAREFKQERREDWDDVKVEILTSIVRSKVNQHTEIRDALLETGSEDIVEVNPNDDFWGNGPDGNGQNHTGKILMKIREELKSN